MNAGRDVEQLIASWLVEEAPGRAPDRVLGDAAHRIDRTKQQRFAAAWREPMIISTGRLVAAAAVVLVTVIGAGMLGRASAPDGGRAGATQPPASPGETATATPGVSPTIQSYRSSRDAICQRASASAEPLNDALDGVYSQGLSAEQRSAKIDVLQQIVDRGRALRTEIADIPVPATMAADVTAVTARSEDVQAILEQEIVLLKAGKLSEAQEVDKLTEPINELVQQFEQKYELSPCP